MGLPLSNTKQLEVLLKIAEDEKLTRLEAATLWNAWERVFREFFAVLGSPEKARARAVGIRNDMPTKRYSREHPRGTEVAVAQDAWIGLGLGGVRIAYSQHTTTGTYCGTR